MSVGVFSAAVWLAGTTVEAQAADGAEASAPAAAVTAIPQMQLEWVPPALEQLSTRAAAKTSFTLDRNMLSMAAGALGGSDDATREAISRLDGVSVHMLRFGDAAMADPGLLDAVRDAYRARGWKHLVTTSSTGNATHNTTTDVWAVMDGANLRGAVVMVQSPKSLTLATVAGNLSPLDLLHLRGHFGIPRFDGDRLEERR